VYTNINKHEGKVKIKLNNFIRSSSYFKDTTQSKTSTYAPSTEQQGLATQGKYIHPNIHNNDM
jgi:hypothetical protein